MTKLGGELVDIEIIISRVDYEVRKLMVKMGLFGVDKSWEEKLKSFCEKTCGKEKHIHFETDYKNMAILLLKSVGIDYDPESTLE
jgi:hypothetical protein